MSHVVILTARAKPDHYETLKETFTAILPDTVKYDGAIAVHATFDDEDQSAVVYEVWQSQAHQQAYLDWRTETGALEALGAMLREPPDFAVYQRLDFQAD